MLEHAYLIPLLPLISAILILFIGRYLPLEGAWIGIIVAFIGLIHALGIVINVYSNPAFLPNEGINGRFFEMTSDWINTGQFRMEMGVLIDGISSMMLFVVTLVSFLVQIFSLGYQHGKPRFGRYYAYLSLFTASMLLLVVANNLLQFFIGWELVGVCSYLLIGFEFEREAAAYSGRKAFMTTKVGDIGFYIGLLLLFTAVGSYNFVIIQQEHISALSSQLTTAIALLLFFGAIGKSAQFPLHVWLPDAMEGPTPVSALIHAATMVAAGVYLVGRFFFVFEQSPFALTVVAWVGAITALGAALSALTARDIKKVLAYSTISQLGYMMLAMGVGNPHAAMFHLTTHAFFKALLFLGAGSVIHAVHTNDMWKMGGLSKKLPATFITFLCATLAIIGVPGFAGFFSKEAILAAVYDGHHTVLFAIAGFTAFLTAFYMCRLFILTFLGDTRDPERFAHAHEGGPSMTFPLWVLAVLSVLSGLFLYFIWPFQKWVPMPHGEAHHGSVVLLVSLGALILGVPLAFSMYRVGTPDPKKLANRFRGIYYLLNERFFDGFYLWLIEKFIYVPARFLSKFDYNVMDQLIVDGVGWMTTKIAKIKSWFDDVFVDGILVNGMGVISQFMGAGLRRLQTGIAQFYLLVVAFGVSLLILWSVRVLS